MRNFILRYIYGERVGKNAAHVKSERILAWLNVAVDFNAESVRCADGNITSARIEGHTHGCALQGGVRLTGYVLCRNGE